jgi:hypothetical protein
MEEIRLVINAILCVFAVLAGLGMLLVGIFDLRKAHRAKAWPVAEGRILESRLREKTDSDGTSYEVAILYEYSVNGVTHRSDVWRIRPASSSFTKASSRTVARYPVGSAVSVYFNPEDPTDAMLEPGKISWVLFLVGVVFAASGVACVLHNLSG